MVAAAIVGGAVVGTVGSSMAAGAQADAAGDAAAVQAQAQREATAEQRRQYNQTREDLAPYRDTGNNALQQYAALSGIRYGKPKTNEDQSNMLSEEEMQEAREMFKSTPGYEFRMEEGIRARDRSAAAKGGLRGGGYGRELVRYGQGLASEEYNNYKNSLAALAGIGQTATNTGVAAGQNSANNISNLYMQGGSNQAAAINNAGAARASGYVGMANSISNGINQYAGYQVLQQQPPRDQIQWWN